MPKAMVPMEGLLFGADPELFVVNPEGEFVSADGLIPGTKERPHKVEHGAVQVDGFAAEFNIDPVDNYKDWRRNIFAVRKQLQDMLPNGHKLVCVPTAVFSREQWDAASDQSKMLGCSPDYNAWTQTVNPSPDAPPFIRHAGGHIHVGWTDDANPSDKGYVKSCIDLVRQLDWFLGAWSVKKDPDVARRAMYGKAGAMRFKPYGVEYRTLSNFWLDTDNDSTVLLETWNRLQAAIHGMRNQFLPDLYADYSNSLIQGIDTSSLDTIALFTFPVDKYRA